MEHRFKAGVVALAWNTVALCCNLIYHWNPRLVGRRLVLQWYSSLCCTTSAISGREVGWQSDRQIRDITVRSCTVVMKLLSRLLEDRIYLRYRYFTNCNFRKRHCKRPQNFRSFHMTKLKIKETTQPA